MSTRADRGIGRLQEAVDLLDDAAFNVATTATVYVEPEEPLARLVTVEAVAITNRVRSLTGGPWLTLGRCDSPYQGAEFHYTLGDRPLSKGGEALRRLVALSTGPVG